MFQGDIRDADFVRKVCRGASVVFHMASIIDVYNSMEYGEMYGINVKGKESHLHSKDGIFSLFKLGAQWFEEVLGGIFSLSLGLTVCETDTVFLLHLL